MVRGLLPDATVSLGLAWAAAVPAHPGGLNAQGCHNDRKHGSYHCHNGGASRPRSGAARAGDLAAVGATRGGGGAAYRNCAAARAAGAAPVRADGPGYGRHLDRDGDGVGCE